MEIFYAEKCIMRCSSASKGQFSNARLTKLMVSLIHTINWRLIFYQVIDLKFHLPKGKQGKESYIISGYWYKREEVKPHVSSNSIGITLLIGIVYAGLH